MVIRLPPTAPIDPCPRHPCPFRQCSSRRTVTNKVLKRGVDEKIIRTTLENQQKEHSTVRSPVIPCFIIHGEACLGHAVLLTVITADGPLHMAYAKFVHHPKATPKATVPHKQGWRSERHALRRAPLIPIPESNYEPFNSSSDNICSWSWNYRGCWHQTCPPILTQQYLYLLLIPTPTK